MEYKLETTDNCKQPMISIIVPVFNAEKFLHKCIDSIIEQTFTDFELILVEGGSPDRCGAICDEYKLKDSRISVIHKENLGLSDDRNAGLNIAKGKYIGFVDSDDWIAPNMFEVLYEHIVKNDADIAQCNFIRTSSEKVKCSNNINIRSKIYSGKEAIKLLYQSNNLFPSVSYTVAWNKLYKKSFFEKLRFPKGRFFEDQFLTYLNFYKSNKIVVLNCPLYYYRINRKSQSNRPYSIRFQDDLVAHERQLAFFRKNNEDEIYRIVFKRTINLLVHHYFTSEQFINDGSKTTKMLLNKARKMYKESIKSDLLTFKEKLNFSAFILNPKIFRQFNLKIIDFEK